MFIPSPYVHGAWVPNPLHPGNIPALAHLASPVLAHPLLPGLFTPNPAFSPQALRQLTAATLVHPGLLAAGGTRSLALRRGWLPPAGVNPAFALAATGVHPAWAFAPTAHMVAASAYSGSAAGFGPNPQQVAVAHVMAGLH